MRKGWKEVREGGGRWRKKGGEGEGGGEIKGREKYMKEWRRKENERE